MSIKHRWMDVVKRGTSALVSSSPRSDAGTTSGTSGTSASSSASAASATKDSNNSNNSQSLLARRSFALSLPGIATMLATDDDSSDAPERDSATLSAMGGGVTFVHFSERCESVGACSVANVLELCMLQGGVHHTHMNILTYLGSPLRVDTCCYAMSVQWFRALHDRDDFQLIPDACDEWFTPTADDIGAKILAKVAMQDEDTVRTKLLEYGPIKEDPDVRSKVETYLERRSVLFMGLESLAVQDGGEHYPNNIDMRESWTLLIDDRRVRLTCESSLLPPFEGFYTSSIRIEIVRSSPHEFYLYLADNCYVHLRAESNAVRDIIVLTLRAFCRSAVSSELINDAIAKGISPMLTIRTLAAAEQQELEQQHSVGRGSTNGHTHLLVKSPPAYSLPWNQPSVGAGAILLDEDNDSDNDDGSGDAGGAPDRLSETGLTRLRTASESLSVTSCDFFNDSVLQDAEALIGNAMKMGLQNHLLLPRAPKRISVTEIPDLQIIEAMENNDDDGASASGSLATPARRRRQLSKKSIHPDSEWRSRSSSLDVQASVCVSESQYSGGDETIDTECTPQIPEIDGESLDDAIRKFQRHDYDEIEALRSQYVAIFCELQRELSESKARAKSLSERLNETTEENHAFRSDIVLLQDALSSVQIADRVREVVASDLRGLVRAASASERDATPRDLFF